jgi:hypothetical protein
MTTRALHAIVLCAAITSASAVACARATPRTDTVPSFKAQAEWRASLATATQETVLGRYGVADRVLSDYAAKFPSTAEAAEATYWRAIFKLDPANVIANPREGAALLDAYTATPYAASRRGEVQTLRRIAGALELRNPAPLVATGPAPAVQPGVAAPAKVDEKAREEEMQRLRDELAKANAELERIRRRLAQPKP